MPGNTTSTAGKKIRVRVDRITPSKMFVRLPGGETGIIRQREVSWEEERPDLHKVTRVGDTLEAVVLPRFASDDELLELSLRLAKRNPWEECGEECQTGQVVEGVVKRVRRFGAFVELILDQSKGIEGFLPVDEISPCWLNEAQEALWPGDVVQAIVTEFDPASFQLRLSIKAYLRRMKEVFDALDLEEGPREATFAEHLRSRDLQKLKQLLEQTPQDLTPPVPRRIRRLLVVDDQDPFREQMVATLRGWGYRAEGAATLQEAQEKFSVDKPDHAPFDGVFLDLSLRGDVSVAWAKSLRKAWPECHILLLSGKEIEATYLAEIEATALSLEYKPFFVEDLIIYLHRWEEEKPVTLDPQEAPPLVSARGPVVSGEEREVRYTDQDVVALLQNLAERNHCQGAALFAESREQPGKVVVLAAWGVTVDQDEESLNMLWYSPVGEVLRGKKRVSIEDRTRQQGYARYLYEAVHSFRAAWGWQLTSPIVEKPAAFFLFSRRVADREDRPRVGPATLHTLETLLDRWQIFQVLEKAQEELLRSQLRAGALHDVRNTLNPLDFLLHNLSQQIQALVDEEDVTLADLSADITVLLDEVQSTVGQMRHTLDLFRSLIDKHQSTETDIHSLIRQSLARFRPMAEDLGVTLHFEPAASLPSGYFSPTRLRQVLDNLILNAIQWSGQDPRCASKTRLLKRVVVSTRYVAPKKLPVRIYISDTGPGIHQALIHHKIYEFGYSRREEGSGLGLFIAKLLLKAMGGEIRVVRSVMEVGSVFRIRLPETPSEVLEGEFL